MQNVNDILYGYENTKLIKHDELNCDFPNTHDFEEISGKEITGVLKANQHINRRLLQTYSSQENHVGVIAATRLGKTSQYVIPTIISFAKQKVKRRMIIADPKGELYKNTAETLRKEGYNVKLINLRQPLKSEYWNPLTPIFRAYKKAYNLEEEVKVVQTQHGPRNEFLGIVFHSQRELDETIERLKKIQMEDVAAQIDSLVSLTISVESHIDPFWEQAAATVLKSCIWACLEDSDPHKVGSRTLITEDNFSYSTILTIMEGMHDGEEYGFKDGGFFTSRPANSRALILAKDAILTTASNTRRCILNVFNTKMSVYKSSTMRLITSCNSFEFKEFTDEKPIALFISFRDELKEHYQVISTFVQSAYAYLIDYATNSSSGKLDIPFYFVLDEFGQFPEIKNFENVISACGGRQIWFILVIQSLGQLKRIYGDAAKIIWDNLNVHVFIGSNNPETLQDFSKECGEWTRIAPVSVLNGEKEEIDHYMVETIPLVPKSALAKLEEGTCIVTEANCGYVLFSKLERYFKCKEFNNLPLADDAEYSSMGNPFDNKHGYIFKAVRHA